MDSTQKIAKSKYLEVYLHWRWFICSLFKVMHKRFSLIKCL